MTNPSHKHPQKPEKDPASVLAWGVAILLTLAGIVALAAIWNAP